MSSASLHILRKRHSARSVASALAREPLVTKGLLASGAIAAIHVVAPRLGISGQLTQDLVTLVDPLVVIGLVFSTRHKVTPTADPRHRDGRKLVPEDRG